MTVEVCLTFRITGIFHLDQQSTKETAVIFFLCANLQGFGAFSTYANLKERKTHSLYVERCALRYAIKKE